MQKVQKVQKVQQFFGLASTRARVRARMIKVGEGQGWGQYFLPRKSAAKYEKKKPEVQNFRLLFSLLSGLRRLLCLDVQGLYHADLHAPVFVVVFVLNNLHRASLLHADVSELAVLAAGHVLHLVVVAFGVLPVV